MEQNYVRQANRVSVVSLIVNAILFAFKLVAGLLAASSAMVSDSVHSLSDCFSTIVVVIGIRLAGKKADREHPYGHERLECIAALILSAMLFATSFVIGYNAVKSVVAVASGAESEKSAYLPLALAAAILSIAVKFILYLYTQAKAKKLNSSALHGDALHHLSDSLSSIGSVVGVLGSLFGIAVLDPAASFIICVMIFKAALDICFMAVDQLVDKAADAATEEKIRNILSTSGGVKRIDVLRTRRYGNRIFVEIEIAVDARLKLITAHRIAEKAHLLIEEEIPEVKHCTIHVNPITDCGLEPDNHENPSQEW